MEVIEKIECRRTSLKHDHQSSLTVSVVILTQDYDFFSSSILGLWFGSGSSSWLSQPPGCREEEIRTALPLVEDRVLWPQGTRLLPWEGFWTRFENIKFSQNILELREFHSHYETHGWIKVGNKMADPHKPQILNIILISWMFWSKELQTMPGVKFLAGNSLIVCSTQSAPNQIVKN